VLAEDEPFETLDVDTDIDPEETLWTLTPTCDVAVTATAECEAKAPLLTPANPAIPPCPCATPSSDTLPEVFATPLVSRAALSINPPPLYPILPSDVVAMADVTIPPLTTETTAADAVLPSKRLAMASAENVTFLFIRIFFFKKEKQWHRLVCKELLNL